jgi:hypothetical protein
MENLLKAENVISAELWRAWEARGKRHDEAIARKIKLAAGLVIGMLALAAIFYLFVTR